MTARPIDDEPWDIKVLMRVEYRIEEAYKTCPPECNMITMQVSPRELRFLIARIRVLEKRLYGGDK